MTRRTSKPEQPLLTATIALLSALALPALHPAFAQAPEWAQELVSETFADPTAVTAGDMDGDGDLDLIAVAEGNNAINWMENEDGLGTTWTKVLITNTFTGVSNVAVGDLDNDGDLDVAAVSPTTDDIAVWRNLNGIGTSWSTPTTLDGLFEGANSVTMADIDRDGNLDILATAPDEDEVAWFDNWLGNGTSFLIRRPSETVEMARSPRAGDLDNDGDIDIVAVAEGNSAVIWLENLNDIGTSWVKNPLRLDLDGARDVAVGDLDGDGDLDVVGTTLATDSLLWWENVGLGATWVERLISDSVNGADAIEVADLDGDGTLDIAVTASNDNDLLWFANAPGDAWIENTIEDAFTALNSVALADLDGDDDLDVASAATGPQLIRWWKNDPLLWTAGTCPGPVEIEIALAGPSHNAAIFFSASEGLTEVPPGRPCFGTPLGLEAAQFATITTTGPAGNASLDPTLADGSCGAFIQMIDLTTCETSGVATIPQ